MFKANDTSLSNDQLKVGLAQLAPVWLNRAATTNKVVKMINRAGGEQIDLLAFGEALIPGYPYWVAMSDGARFNATDQKELHSRYMEQAVVIEAGHLKDVCTAAKDNRCAVYLGIIERPMQRGGHSVYCTMVYIDKNGEIQSTHRKLMPTYEERLTWSAGDGNGLQVHSIGPFNCGGLNCWENWMPLSRTALYAQGEDLHVAIWPGCYRNTHDLTRFIAKEGRSFSMAASGLMRKSDFPKDTPHLAAILAGAGEDEMLSNGGSCLAGPDGEWIIAPQCDEEGLYSAVIDQGRVREERQNFDIAGHYSRSDVTKLTVDRRRQSIIETID